MQDRQAADASWALVTEGVTAARLDLHALETMLGKFEAVCKHPKYREVTAKLFGDLVKALPETLKSASRSLDRTSYALAKMGEDHLKDRLSLEDRAQVEDGVQSPQHTMRSHLARRYVNEHR